MRVSYPETCFLCGQPGQLYHRQLQDHLFDAPGQWSFQRCSNEACRLFWLYPQPFASDIHLAYQGYYTHTAEDGLSGSSRLYEAIQYGYLQTRLGYTQDVGELWYRLLAPLAHLYPSGATATLSKVMFLPAPAPGARLLDVGCGSGGFLATMQRLGWQVEGSDFDPVAVRAAQARGLSVREGDLLELGYADQSFDALTMRHLIEHVYQPLELLQEARRILKPGGQLVLLTPNTLSWGHRHFGADWRGLEPPRHIQLFNNRNIHQLLQLAGYEQRIVQTLSSGAHYILSMSAALQQARLQARRSLGFGQPAQTPKLKFYQLWERFLHNLQPDIGEELLVIARP